MLKYLEKVRLFSETAANGQECIDMVLSKDPGYYSLIIVSLGIYFMPPRIRYLTRVTTV